MMETAMDRLSKPQKVAFAYWRRMGRLLCGGARADLENAFAAGWLAGRAAAPSPTDKEW